MVFLYRQLFWNTLVLQAELWYFGFNLPAVLGTSVPAAILWYFGIFSCSVTLWFCRLFCGSYGTASFLWYLLLAGRWYFDIVRCSAVLRYCQLFGGTLVLSAVL